MKTEKLILDFLDYLENKKGRSWRTARNYDLYLKRFAGWTNDQKVELKDVTEENISGYYKFLEEKIDPVRKTKMDVATRNYHLIALRNFLRYLIGQNVKVLSPARVRLYQHPKKEALTLSKQELNKLFESVSGKAGLNVIEIRNRAILELLFATGIKVSELVSLEVDDVKLKNKKVKLNNREVELSNQAVYWLNEYFKKRDDDVKYLFVSFDNANSSRKIKPLSERSIERLIQQFGKIMDIKLTPQVIRNTFIKQKILAGVDVEMLKKQIGVDHHVNI